MGIIDPNLIKLPKSPKIWLIYEQSNGVSTYIIYMYSTPPTPPRKPPLLITTNKKMLLGTEVPSSIYYISVALLY